MKPSGDIAETNTSSARHRIFVAGGRSRPLTSAPHRIRAAGLCQRLRLRLHVTERSKSEREPEAWLCRHLQPRNFGWEFDFLI